MEYRLLYVNSCSLGLCEIGRPMAARHVPSAMHILMEWHGRVMRLFTITVEEDDADCIVPCLSGERSSAKTRDRVTFPQAPFSHNQSIGEVSTGRA